MSYEDIYFKRLNRYGYDYKTRLQNQRERDFENKLLKSVYHVDFVYDGEIHPGTLERFKQDETQLLQYLLTRVSLEMPNGTILMIPDKNDKEQAWMVYWLEEIQASGYNRYIMIKMTHFLTWRANDLEYSSWAYMHGPGKGSILESLKSSGKGTIYTENNNAYFFILPKHPALKRDCYLEVGTGEEKEAFLVTGCDIQSTPGVEFVTLDPVFLRDNSTVEATEGSEDSFWLNGGR